MTTIVFEGRIKSIARGILTKLGNSLWRLIVGCFKYVFGVLLFCSIFMLIGWTMIGGFAL